MPAMLEALQKAYDDFQKVGKDNYDVMLRSFGELNKAFQAIGVITNECSKRAVEDANRVSFPKIPSGLAGLHHQYVRI
jgi:hypothetical protein